METTTHKAPAASSPKVGRPRDAATSYAKKVTAGKIIAGPHVRAACARHLHDLQTAAARGLVWDVAAAEHALAFFREVLCLNGGEYEGAPFAPLAWQQFVVGSLCGWKSADGYRRFRVAYIETAKGSGKSPLAAGLGLYGLTADGEERAEVYAAATKRDQAMVLFRDAVAMWQQSPHLHWRLKPSGVGQNVWNLAYLERASFFRPISAADGQSGPRPHIALVDEVHEHKTNAVVEMLRAGTKSRRQALIFMITNSGASRSGPCWDYHQRAIRIAQGLEHDDAFFGYVCALDEGEDPITDERCWAKANPSLQEADLPGAKYLREQVREARGMPSKEALVRRLCFCEWTDAESPWISYDVWRGAQREYDWQSLAGRRAWGGLDLASTTDLAAFVLLVEPVEEGEPWRILPWAWTPADGVARKVSVDRQPYDAWIAAGHLETTPGRAISKLFVAQRVAEISAQFEVQEIAFDRWQFESLRSIADDAGIALPPMVPFGQGYKDMAPAISAFETKLLNGEVVHNGHPVLTMCAANAVTECDAAENRKLSKQKATGRIDLMVATVMAAGRAEHGAVGDDTSFWDTE